MFAGAPAVSFSIDSTAISETLVRACLYFNKLEGGLPFSCLSICFAFSKMIYFHSICLLVELTLLYASRL
jgi:hypothetical protein